MATIRQRNNAYSVIYKFTDENGETRQKWESFKTMADAKARKKEVEYKESIGTFVVPTCKTVNELLTEYVELYGKSKWALSTYESNVRMIENYVRPTIGSMKLTEINTHALERYYQSLLKMPAVANNARKPKKRTISPHTVRDIHKILRCSFGQAKKWGLMERNPADGAMLPKYEPKKRVIWTAETLFEAQKLCDNPRLVLALNLSFCCSLRIGEMLGLTWDCIDITQDSIDAGTASVIIDKELQRVNRTALAALEQKDVRFVFPVQSAAAKTVMVLKKPKTESSIRKVYMPKAIANMIAAWKERQDEEKEILGDEYRDYALVFAGPTGYPIEQNTLNKALKRLIKENDLPPVTFHSFRHTSVTYKLKLNGGDIKSVQGDTGHAQASMVTEVYSHILDDGRKGNALLLQKAFYEHDGKPKEKLLQEMLSEQDKKRKEQLSQTDPVLPDMLPPEILAKVLTNPQVVQLITSLAQSM